jgi:hypothetical protein
MYDDSLCAIFCNRKCSSTTAARAGEPAGGIQTRPEQAEIDSCVKKCHSAHCVQKPKLPIGDVAKLAKFMTERTEDTTRDSTAQPIWW